jgi:hypothetical protein
LDKIIKQLPIYYKHINKLPIENYFFIQENKLEYLYKIRLFKRIPNFFKEIEYEMNFQHDKINMEKIYKLRDIVFLESLAARTGNNVQKFIADSKRKEFNNEMIKENNKGEKLTMNGMFNYIETTLNCIGTLNGQMNTARIFSLYNLSIEKNKNLANQYKNKK